MTSPITPGVILSFLEPVLTFLVRPLHYQVCRRTFSPQFASGVCRNQCDDAGYRSEFPHSMCAPGELPFPNDKSQFRSEQ